MGKTAEADPNEGLAQDAAIATDLGDEKERQAAQLEYYGGDPLDDDEDLTALDRGDMIPGDEEESTDRGDEVSEEEDEDDEESEESDDESDDEGDDDGDDEIADDDDGDSEDEDADEDDQDDSESDDDEEEEEESKSRDQRIPLSRFNEVNERMKRAEARLAQLEQQDQAEEQAEEQSYDFDKAEEEYMDLLLDGKTAEAAAKRREIRTAEKADYLATSRQDTQQTVTQDAVVRELNSLVAQSQQMYPVFDENSADYNPTISAKTVTFMKGYVADGMEPSEAFVAALADSIDLYDLDGAKKADPEPKPEKKVTQKKAISKKKEKADLQKKQHRTPAGEGRGSADAGAVVPDISKLSDEDIDALPPETLARLRGDYVD